MCLSLSGCGAGLRPSIRTDLATSQYTSFVSVPVCRSAVCTLDPDGLTAEKALINGDWTRE